MKLVFIPKEARRENGRLARARKWGIEDIDRIYAHDDLEKGDCSWGPPA